MKTNKKFFIEIGVIVALALVGLLLGFLDAKSFGLSYADEGVQTVYVKSEDDLRSMGKSFYNNIVYLENDIAVSELSVLADKEHPFVGVFDGQGHTVTLTGDAAVRSLFGYIGEGGAVRNLRIVVEESVLASRAMGAVLALENAGTVKDCRVSVNTCRIEARGNFGGVVGINNGVLENVAAEVNFVGALSADDADSSYAMHLGALAAYNRGSILCAVVSVTYRDIKEADGDITSDPNSYVKNRGVGAAVGNNLNDGTLTKVCALIESGTNLYDVHTDSLVFTSTVRNEIYSIDNLFENLCFNEEIWELLGGELVFLQGV